MDIHLLFYTNNKEIINYKQLDKKIELLTEICVQVNDIIETNTPIPDKESNYVPRTLIWDLTDSIRELETFLLKG